MTDLNVKANTIKVLREVYIGLILYNLGLDNKLNQSTKRQIFQFKNEQRI